MADACALHNITPCAGPGTEQLYAGGNAYLRASFPELDYIVNATVLKGEGGDGAYNDGAGADALAVLAVGGGLVLTVLGLRRVRERRAAQHSRDGGRGGGAGVGECCGLLGPARREGQDASSNLMLADFGDASVRLEDFHEL